MLDTYKNTTLCTVVLTAAFELPVIHIQYTIFSFKISQFFIAYFLAAYTPTLEKHYS